MPEVGRREFLLQLLGQTEMETPEHFGSFQGATQKHRVTNLDHG